MLFRFWFPVGDSGFSLSLDLQSGRSPFHQEVLRRAELLDVLGLHVKVATREDLVLLKLAAWRPIDRADAIDLLQFTNGCDDKYLDHWAALLGLEDRLSEARSS